MRSIQGCITTRSVVTRKVTSPYASHGETVGVLGIVGPTRMPYENVIPVVDLTARLLGAALAK